MTRIATNAATLRWCMFALAPDAVGGTLSRYVVLVALALHSAAAPSFAQAGAASGSQLQHPFTRSVRTREAAPVELPLSLKEAIERGGGEGVAYCEK